MHLGLNLPYLEHFSTMSLPWTKSLYTLLSLHVLRLSQQSDLVRSHGSWSLSNHHCYWWSVIGDLSAWIPSMQHPLQPPHLACLSQSLQLIYSTWSCTIFNDLTLDHFLQFYLLCLFKFNHHKTKSGMMGTFCSHHLPLRTLLPKLVFSPKNPIDFPSLVGVLTTEFNCQQTCNGCVIYIFC